MVFETAMPSTIGDSFTLLSYEEEDATMRLRRLQDQLDGDGDDRNASEMCIIIIIISPRTV